MLAQLLLKLTPQHHNSNSNNIFEIGVSALLTPTLPLTSTRNAILSVRNNKQVNRTFAMSTFSRSGGTSIDGISSRLFANDERNQQQQDQNLDLDLDLDVDQDHELDSIPNIQELRDIIRKRSRMRSSNAPNEAASALRDMVRFYSGSNNKSNNKEKGQRIINRPSVDVIDCNQVINAWSKSRQQDAPQQALAILKGMMVMYKKDGNKCIRPNVITYTSVINAFARRGDFDGSSAVFTMQVNDFKQENNIEAKPNAYTFSAMINACSKSNRDDMPEISEKLLTAMNDWYSTAVVIL